MHGHPLQFGLLATAMATSLAVLATPSLAQPFPARPIRVISPNPAGAGQDVELRQLTPHMSADLGVPIVVENRPGGSQLLGMEIVAKATPDGYTLGGGTTANLASNPRLFDRPLYDVERNLAPVIDKLSKAAARAAQTAQYREFTAKNVATAVGSTPAEFDTFMKSERARWKKVIVDNGIKLD